MARLISRYGGIQIAIPQQVSNSGLFYVSRRSWVLFFDVCSFNFPHSYADAMLRFHRNLNHFRVNYAYIALIILFFSLIYQPGPMLAFMFICVLWINLFFKRDEPVEFCNGFVDDRAVLVGLTFFTVAALVYTEVEWNVLMALIIAIAFIGIHGLLKNSENLFLDESEAVEEGLIEADEGIMLSAVR